MKLAFLIAGCLCCGACGDRPHALGVTTNSVRITRALLEPSPADLAARVVDGREDFRADLVGDPTPERLVRLPRTNTIEVRDASGSRVGAVTTVHYITDFGTMTAADGAPRLVVYTYPNADKGATYAVFNRSLHEETHWEEFPATSQFATAAWNGGPAVFYLQQDTLIARDPDGTLLTRLPVPEGNIFSRVMVLNLSDTRLALVASGNGYTPFHMVAVYDAGKLVYHEVADEHAFELGPSAGGFVVSTRSSRWAYRVP